MDNFAQILTKAYLNVPEQMAITLLDSRLPEHQMTYRDLYLGAVCYAHVLQKSGIQPGDIVIIILQHSHSLVEAFFGAILHGAIPAIMPFLSEKLSPDHYRKSLEALFRITTPTAVITYRDFVFEVEKAKVNAPSIRAVLVSDEIPPTNNLDINTLKGLQRSPQEIVLLQHSSGTTGLQKGVALSHVAVFKQLESYTKAIHLNSHPSGNDVIVSWLPLYHDMGLIAGFIMPILERVPLVLMSPFDWVRAPCKLLEAISQYKGTLAWLPNFAYNFCAQKIRQNDLEGLDLSSWRAVINCSEPMVWQSHQMFLERFKPLGFQSSALATCYAMAENVFAVTQGGIDNPVNVDLVDLPSLITQQVATPADDPLRAVKMLSAGTPIQNTHLRVVTPDGKSLPERKIGEIAISSDCLLTGYYNRPEITHQSFLDGWFLTGDLGYLAKNELYITGRKKDLLIIGGKNIYPQDLERLASEVKDVHPGRVAAFGLFNPQIGTEEGVVVAEVEVTDEKRLQIMANEIRDQVTRGSDIALRYVKLVEPGWLLKTSSGKVARAANREKYLNLFAEK